MPSRASTCRATSSWAASSRAAVLALYACLLLVAAPATAVPQVPYRPPVDGDVLRPFELLADEYGPGSHRGVDLAVRPHDPVHAAANGVVEFVGPVAGDTWVTLRHADGIETTYGAFALVVVDEGQQVGAGQLLGAARGDHRPNTLAPADDGLHWGARRGGTYLDPMSLLVDLVPTLVGPGGWEGTHPVVEGWDWAPDPANGGYLETPSRPATTQGAALRPNGHHAVVIGGLGSSFGDGIVPLHLLGYGPNDVSRFSYRGCVESDGVCSPRPYLPSDTNLHIEDQLDLLDAHLRERQRREPHRPVDLVGHSMGGDLAYTYLVTRYDPSDLGLPPIGSVVPVAAPLGGSVDADLASAVGDHLAGNAIEVARSGLAALGVDPAASVGFGSGPQERYRRGGQVPVGPAAARRLGELGVDVTSIAGASDSVVGIDRARGPHGRHVVAPGGHSEVARNEATLGILHDVLAGREPTGEQETVGESTDAAIDARRLDALVIELSNPVSLGRNLLRGDVPGIATDVTPGPNTLAPQPPGRAATRDPRTGRRLPIEVTTVDRDGEPTGRTIPLDPGELW